MASSIKLEAILITTHLPHGSKYYIASGFKSSMCGVLKCSGLVVCKLNICDVTCIESDMFLLGIINAMMNLKQFGLLVLICVETNWPGS